MASREIRDLRGRPIFSIYVTVWINSIFYEVENVAIWLALKAFCFVGVNEFSFQGLEAANNQQWARFLKATGMETVGLTTEQVMTKWAAHALVGGVMSVLQGGKFGHGFVSAGLTQALSGGISKIGGSPQSSGYFSAGNRALRIFAAAILGGTASKISGGKFANGAVTGAFSRALNDEAHSFAQRGPTGNFSPVPGSYFDENGVPVTVEV
ncbi:DUF637 domain-containing protein [Microbulbifer thermotolerans]|uniref:DUF637 domain-containing protein n=1 Tax=Microbulbifer thermotolerans TaxID=252514 RepID=UPI00224B12EC|nr:DUF637 domain-containing protein [Microbulbifer thermotolerans]MCX2836472.1 DUF637 domain-containing protein [Microbulbifer thermotolerans]